MRFSTQQQSALVALSFLSAQAVASGVKAAPIPKSNLGKREPEPKISLSVIKDADDVIQVPGHIQNQKREPVNWGNILSIGKDVGSIGSDVYDAGKSIYDGIEDPKPTGTQKRSPINWGSLFDVGKDVVEGAEDIFDSKPKQTASPHKRDPKFSFSTIKDIGSIGSDVYDAGKSIYDGIEDPQPTGTQKRSPINWGSLFNVGKDVVEGAEDIFDSKPKQTASPHKRDPKFSFSTLKDIGSIGSDVYDAGKSIYDGIEDPQPTGTQKRSPINWGSLFDVGKDVVEGAEDIFDSKPKQTASPHKRDPKFGFSTIKDIGSIGSDVYDAGKSIYDGIEDPQPTGTQKRSPINWGSLFNVGKDVVEGAEDIFDSKPKQTASAHKRSPINLGSIFNVGKDIVEGAEDIFDSKPKQTASAHKRDLPAFHIGVPILGPEIPAHPQPAFYNFNNLPKQVNKIPVPAASNAPQN